MSSPLRELFALFDVDTGAAHGKLTKLSASTDLAKQALAGLAMAAVDAFTVRAAWHFIDDMIQLGSTINDTADRLGIAADELQKFQMAAGLAGADAEEAAKGLGFLNRSIGEALGGSKEATAQFTELGVAIKDSEGNVRELGDVIPDVADAFEKMGSDQERTAKAMQLFGRSGASLLPILKQGSGELRKMNEQFDALSLGINGDFIKAADDAGDQIDILKLGFRGLKTRLALEVLPYVSEGAKRLQTVTASAIQLTKETNIVSEAWAGLGVTAALAAGKSVHHWSKLLGLVPKNAGFLQTILGLGKTGLAVGGMTLLGAAVEDVIGMCMGADSVLGDFLDEFVGVEEKEKLVESLTQAWEDMQPAIADLAPLFTDFMRAAAESLPYVIAGVTDLIKVVMSAATGLVGLGEWVATVTTKGWSAGDKVTAEQAKKQANIWRTGSTLEKVMNANPSISANDPAIRQGATISNGDTTVSVTVNGGPANSDTGRAVKAGVKDALGDAANRDAANALFEGPAF